MHAEKSEYPPLEQLNQLGFIADTVVSLS